MELFYFSYTYSLVPESEADILFAPNLLPDHYFPHHLQNMFAPVVPTTQNIPSLFAIVILQPSGQPSLSCLRFQPLVYPGGVGIT